MVGGSKGAGGETDSVTLVRREQGLYVWGWGKRGVGGFSPAGQERLGAASSFPPPCYQGGWVTCLFECINELMAEAVELSISQGA